MKNNIDKIFNESLQHYERQPRTEAWEKLQARLEKRDSKVLPLWWKYASAASVALLLGVGGYWFSNQKADSVEQIAIHKNPILEKKTSTNNPAELTGNLQEQLPQTEEIVKSGKNINPRPVAGAHWDAQSSPHVHKQQQLENQNKLNFVADVQSNAQARKDLQNQNNPIIALETIKPKTQTEENTIVLVLENTKPQKEEETIVLNFVDTPKEVITQNTEPEKKQSRVGKIWEQLKRAKNGENVNWGEVGLKPQKVLARADAKIENVLTRGESEK